jgi:hypothetical protein
VAAPLLTSYAAVAGEGTGSTGPARASAVITSWSDLDLAAANTLLVAEPTKMTSPSPSPKQPGHTHAPPRLHISSKDLALQLVRVACTRGRVDKGGAPQLVVPGHAYVVVAHSAS